MRYTALHNAMTSIETNGGGYESAIGLCRTSKNHKIFFVGNGGSAAIASHMAVDFTKAGGFSALCFNDAAALTCLANDLGYQNVFSYPLLQFGAPKDILFAISSSGQSMSIINAVTAAKSQEMSIITLSGFTYDNPLRRLGHINFYVPSDKYGIVEICHLAICHSILDQLVETK